MSKIDLHIHSHFSNDGEFSISEIIEKSIKNSIEVLSITDHNSVKGSDEAYKLSAENDIHFIPGVEIDCVHNGIDLHLLGYNIDWKSKDFIGLEKDNYNKTTEAFPVMVENLRKIGFDVDEDIIFKKSGNMPPSAELIAEVMLGDTKYSNDLLKPYQKGGDRSDMPYINFYLDYFAQGKPAYVKVEFMDFSDALELVMDNGGVPIVAHPGLNLKGQEQLVEKLLDKGAKGMEVFNNYHYDKQIDYFADLCMKRNTIMTCGSDFHGKNKPLIDIGKYNFHEKYSSYLLDSVSKLKDM